MNNKKFITIFIGSHLICLFLQIYKSTLLTKELYKNQRYEQQLTALEKEKNELLYTVQIAQNRMSVKEFAESCLAMKPLALHQIRKYPDE